ncbi:MAG: 5'-nucleotidase C-terminal domain-containing protein [Bacteroidales bacterium]|nr:5'-nucleotidase C-terminal domain-containing protein [Bacteroidales bacterium]
MMKIPVIPQTGCSLLCFAGLLLGSCRSSRYELVGVLPHRYEVTQALDASPEVGIVAFLEPYSNGVDSLEAGYLGQSALYMTGHRPESLLSNWVADVFVHKGREMGYKPDLGVCNVGGLRAALPRGIVRRGDILAIAPFQNFFTILKLKGSTMMQLMHDIAAVHGEGVSSSARLVITRDGKLVSATIGGEVIEPERIYTVATMDYLADGNDKLYAFKNSVERIVTQEPVRETLMNYLRQLDAQGKLATAQLEGRIVETGEVEIQQVAQKPESKVVKDCMVIRPSGKHKSRDLLVVHTNDTHSCIKPLNPHLADTAQANKGGVARRAALMDSLRRQDPELLLLDAGDFSQGSAFYSLYHGEVEVGIMNLMHYDAATIGNHEFDFGLENMARIFRQADFPIVCCNYDFTGTPVEGLVKPYVIIRRNGLKIGIFGLSPQLEGLVSANLCAGVRYIDPLTAAQPVADYLKNDARCDLVICLSHLGWNIPEFSDEELIPATRNIDLVIGGHSHTYFATPHLLKNLDGIDVPDNQMGKNARFIGSLRLSLEK